MKLLIISLFVVSFSTSAQEGAFPKERIIYEYKKYEKFDFDDIVVEGDSGNPGDLSIDPRYQRRFKNKLPYRTNFHKEIRRGVIRIR